MPFIFSSLYLWVFFFCKTRLVSPTVRNSMQSLLCPFCYSLCRFSSRAHSTALLCIPRARSKAAFGNVGCGASAISELDKALLLQALLCVLLTSRRNAHLHPSSRHRYTCTGRGLILTTHIRHLSPCSSALLSAVPFSSCYRTGWPTPKHRLKYGVTPWKQWKLS